MINQAVSPQDACDFLNDLFKRDPGAIYQLIETRVPVNAAAANHPTAQVTRGELGLLGVINGLFGVYDDGERKNWGCIAFRGDLGDEARFEVLPNE